MESSDPEKRAGLGSAMPSDKSINTLAHATAGSDPEKAHGRDGLGSDHHLGRRHADDEDGDDVEETDDDHDSESTRAGEIQPVQSRSQSIINRVLSTRSIDPGPPPDGGWSAWVTALCAHLIVMNSWGFINSFGIFQTYYAEILDMPPSTISWIGSIQVFLLFSIGTLTGRITDAGYFRPVLMAGSALQVLGIFSASFASTYAQFFLAQGVCMGLANGFVFCPTIATLSTYFSSKRSLAIGIGACGSATGGIIFPLIARFLIPRAGLPWTLRTIGFVQLVALVFCNFFLKPRVPPRKAGPLVEWAAFRSLEYSFYAIGAFFFFLGVYFPFYYLASFATSQISPPMSYTSSLDLLLMLNAVGGPGRVVPNHIADKVGVINMLIPSCLIASVIVFGWIGVSSPAGLYVWTAFYGLAGGAIQGLFPAGLSSLIDDPRKRGTRIGMIFTVVSFATLTGPPIAGALIQAADGSYVGAQCFAGACLLIGMCFMIAAKVARSRKTGGDWKEKI